MLFSKVAQMTLLNLRLIKKPNDTYINTPKSDIMKIKQAEDFQVDMADINDIASFTEVDANFKMIGFSNITKYQNYCTCCNNSHHNWSYCLLIYWQNGRESINMQT